MRRLEPIFRRQRGLKCSYPHDGVYAAKKPWMAYFFGGYPHDGVYAPEKPWMAYPFGASLLVLLMGGFFVLCAGCDSEKRTKSPSPTGPLKHLVFWNTMTVPENQTLSTFIDRFCEKHPAVSVNVELVSFWQAQAKFEQAMKAGVVPDLFRADRFWIRQFVKAGYLEEIRPSEIEEELDDLLPIARQVVTVNEKVYGLPQSIDCLGLFYNKAHFQESQAEVPTDMEGFRTAAQKNTNPSKGRYGFFMNPEGWWFEPFLLGFGGRYFDNAGKLTIKTDQTLKATHYLMDLKDSLKVMPPVNIRANAFETMMKSFKIGQVSMIMNGPWAIREILEGSAFKDNASNLGVAPIPKGPLGRFSPVGCQVYVVPKGAKQRKETLQLIRFLCSSEVESTMSKSNFGIPARRSLFSDPELRNDPYLGPFLRQLQECQTLDSATDLGRVYGPISEYLKKVLNGDISPEDGLKDLESAWGGSR